MNLLDYKPIKSLRILLLLKSSNLKIREKKRRNFDFFNKKKFNFF